MRTGAVSDTCYCGLQNGFGHSADPNEQQDILCLPHVSVNMCAVVSTNVFVLMNMCAHVYWVNMCVLVNNVCMSAYVCMSVVSVHIVWVCICVWMYISL